MEFNIFALWPTINQDLQKRTIKQLCQLTILISVANTSCCLSMMCISIGLHIFCKWLGATAHTQAQSWSITTQLLKKSPLNRRTLVHGACVKAGLHTRSTGSAEMQAKRRRLWLLLLRKQCQIVPLILLSTTTNSVARQLLNGYSHRSVAQVSHSDTAAGALTVFFHSQFPTLSLPDPCTLHVLIDLAMCHKTILSVSRGG